VIKDRPITASAVRREILKRTGKRISLSQIGSIGKMEGLSYYDSRLGIRLFNPQIVNLIVRKYLD